MKKKISNISILNKNNLNKKLAERYELKNFLKNKVNFFKKKILTFLATFNIIFFFSKYRELGNLNNNLYSWYFYKNLKFKDKNVYKFKIKKKKTFKNLLIEWFFFLKYFFFLLLFKDKNIYKLKSNKKLKKKISKQPIIKLQKSELIKGFLFVWSTKNNFFVTILDYTGNTLITRTGGNTGRVGTWQWSTIFSADSAMYECCFLAKERGIESLIVHIWSSLRLQQIKHCFEGLTISGLVVESVIYWPIKFFGGCRLKKAWRV